MCGKVAVSLWEAANDQRDAEKPDHSFKFSSAPTFGAEGNAAMLPFFWFYAFSPFTVDFAQQETWEFKFSVS